MQAPTTIQNIEAAFAGESMAHTKYLFFAKVCRAAGDVVTARVFEETAAQEVQHALGHLDLLYPAGSMTPARCLEMAIAGETHEYTEMSRPSAIPQWKKATRLRWRKSTSRLPNPGSMPTSSGSLWRKPPSALRHWPRWKRSTPTTTAIRWPRLK